MSKRLGNLSQRIVLAVLLGCSVATAAFAITTTVHAQSSGRCLLIAECLGDDCAGPGDCGGDYCCTL